MSNNINISDYSDIIPKFAKVMFEQSRQHFTALIAIVLTQHSTNMYLTVFCFIIKLQIVSYLFIFPYLL